MSPLHRRSAERLDDLLEGRAGTTDSLDRRTAELVELVGALRAVPAPEARPAFVSDLRAQLMAAAETELVPAARDAADVNRRLTIAPRTPAQTRRTRKVRVAVGSLAAAGVVTSMGVASQAAVPGDALYPVKRVLESTQTTFSVSDQAKASSLLDSASDRLSEVQELAARDESSLADTTLATFVQQATQGGRMLVADYQSRDDEASIAELTDFTSASMETLTQLKGQLPDSSRGPLIDAANALVALDDEAAAACPDCAGVGLVDVPGTLLASAPLVEVPEVSPQDLLPPAPTPSEAPQVSGLEAPSNPVSVRPIPSEAPTALPTTAAPTQPAPTTPAPTQTAGGGQGGGGGKGPRATVSVPPNPIVSGLGETLDGTLGGTGELLGGVVDGLTGLLGGLTGQTQGPTAP